MPWSGVKIATLVVMMMSVRLFGQEAELRADQQAYCEYISQQAQAQRDLLRTPSVVGGLTQPTAALPAQLFWGVSTSLANMKKAGITMEVARKNCELYSVTTSSQQAISYALPRLEKEALQHRLDLIDKAITELDALIAENTKMLEAQNLTRPALFSVQTTRIKLEADRADTRSKLALLRLPELSDTPLRELVVQKQTAESAEQAALARLNRQNDWDVSLSVGARQQINPFDGRGAYGAVTVSYNLASRSVNRHLDQAATAWDNWKNVQQGDVTRNAVVLKQQVTDGIAAQEAKRASLDAEQKQIEAGLQVVGDVDTTAALEFRNQLRSTQLLLEIEAADAAFRIGQMRDFLTKNY